MSSRRWTSMFKIEIGKYGRNRVCSQPRWEKVDKRAGIRCISPGGYGTSNKVFVTSQGVKSTTSLATANFSYNGPVITDIFPSRIPTLGNRIVNITGYNFGSFEPSVTIYFGNSPCQLSVWISDKLARCHSPVGLGGNLKVLILVDDIISLPDDNITVSYDDPIFYNMIPSFLSTEGGESIRINGSNFGVINPNTRLHNYLKIQVSGHSLNATWVSDSEFKFIAPHGIGVNRSLKISLANISKTFNVIHYAKPTINAITPTSGNTTGGIWIYISGQNFGSHPPVEYYCNDTNTFAMQCDTHSEDVLKVSVDNQESSNVTWISDSSIKFELPPGTGIANAKIWIGNQWSDPFKFQYIRPHITSVAPSDHFKTLGNEVLNIYGTNFGFTPFNISTAITRDIQVYIGPYNRRCNSVTFVSPYHIHCKTPPGLGENNTVSIVVKKLRSTESKAIKINYRSPVITGITPAAICIFLS
jgi:hypothetical protein